MGSGTWSRDSYARYSVNTKAASIDEDTGYLRTSMSNQEMFKSRRLDEFLNPYKVIRECVDTEEHPNTIPIILGLDVTGSMGQASVEIAKRLGAIMTKLYSEITDVEFMIMGIGDLSYDNSPIQASQFESDIRIAEQLDKVYFEFGGGGNYYESYTAAWYFGLNHCKLDCWKRGKKGIIITIGDEQCNPYLPKGPLSHIIGDDLQANVETEQLYKDVCERFNVYHLDIKHHDYRRDEAVYDSWENILGQNFVKSNLDKIDTDVTNVILDAVKNDNDTIFVTNDTVDNNTSDIQRNEAGEITW